MNYETLTQEQLSALHIADVNESFLTFENDGKIKTKPRRKDANNSRLQRK